MTSSLFKSGKSVANNAASLAALPSLLAARATLLSLLRLSRLRCRTKLVSPCAFSKDEYC